MTDVRRRATSGEEGTCDWMAKASRVAGEVLFLDLHGVYTSVCLIIVDYAFSFSFFLKRHLLRSFLICEDHARVPCHPLARLPCKRHQVATSSPRSRRNFKSLVRWNPAPPLTGKDTQVQNSAH